VAASRSGIRRYVLDANALIGFFDGRQPAAERVRKILSEANRNQVSVWMSAINWGEVYYTEWRHYGEAKAQEAEMNLQRLPVVVVEADRDRATRAAALKQKHNLGYADAFAAELAIDRKAWLVTADPEFGRLGKVLSVFPLPRFEK